MSDKQILDKALVIFGGICWHDYDGAYDPKYNFVHYDKSKDKFIFEAEEYNKYSWALSWSGFDAWRKIPAPVWGQRPEGQVGQFSPFVFDKAKKKWVLSEYNTEYEAIWSQAIDIDNSYGIFDILCWEDWCQFHKIAEHDFQKYSAWVHNVEGVSSFAEPKAWPLLRKFINHQIDLYGAKDVMWAMNNEIGASNIVELCKNVFFPIIKERELDFNKIFYGAVLHRGYTYIGNGEYAEPIPEGTLGQMKALAEVWFGNDGKFDMTREVHKCGKPVGWHDAIRPWGEQMHAALKFWKIIRKILSDDGFKEGNSPCDKAPDGAKMTAEDIGAMCEYVWKNYPTSYGGRDRLTNIETLPQNYDVACQSQKGEAISLAYKNTIGKGKFPQNYHKYEYKPLIVPPDPPDPPVEYVTRTVCSVSGLLANPYCPELVERQFVKGTEPTTSCAVHKKPDCKCSYWLETGNWKRWFLCVFGLGSKKCK